MDESLTSVLRTPWAIDPEFLPMIQDALKAQIVNKGEASAKGINAKASGFRIQGAVGVLPVHGVVSYRANILTYIFGGTPIQKLLTDLNDMVNDPGVSTIILDIDSPGGSVAGVLELADAIFKARQKKHIVAVSNPMAASAAYWIASQANELVVTPSGEVGSIGVYMMHSDWSKAYEEAGVKNTIIRAGKYKAEGSPYEPLTEDAQKALQDDVNRYYDMFTKAVARGRGISASQVKETFGQGRMVMATKAWGLGMVDGIGTFDATLARFTSSRNSGNRRTTNSRERRMMQVKVMELGG